MSVTIKCVLPFGNGVYIWRHLDTRRLVWVINFSPRIIHVIHRVIADIGIEVDVIFVANGIDLHEAGLSRACGRHEGNRHQT